MKSFIPSVIALISLSLFVSCSLPTSRNAYPSTPQVTLTVASTITSSPVPSNQPKEASQTAAPHIRATKTARADLTPLTSTLIPSKTLAPLMTSTPSLTPQPTVKPTRTDLPTNTATFDVAIIVTRTSSPPALCPTGNPDLVPAIDSWNSSLGYPVLLPEIALDFLNSGGTPASVVRAFIQEYGFRVQIPALQKDMTGDGVNELLITNNETVLVLGCNNGKYQALLQYDGDEGWVRFVHFAVPGDMNLDGIPELLINEQHGNSNVDHDVTLYEWNGTRFISIIQSKDSYNGKLIPIVVMFGATDVDIRDVDKNGTRELILTGSPPLIGTLSYTVGLPWRNETHLYAWNGASFVLFRIDFSTPEYRFQAVQDGDRATLSGDYAQALDFYQQAVFSDKLDWWSDERWSYAVSLFATWGEKTPTPMSTPTPDPADYYNLSAYARFRIMLLHIARGFLAEAEIVFNTLKEKYPQGQPGYPYVEMAITFWDEYQFSANLVQACDKAVEYAILHPVDILSYLGNGEYARTYYGNQSLEYTPDDICPFR